MTRFLLGRCLGLVLTLLAASAVVFLVLEDFIMQVVN